MASKYIRLVRKVARRRKSQTGSEGGKKMLRLAAIIVLCTTLLPAAYAADKLKISGHYRNDAVFIEPGSGEAMVLDAFVFRPIGLATTLIGGAAFVVSLPFTVLGGNVDEAADKLIVEPIDYTFKRKLGDL